MYEKRFALNRRPFPATPDTFYYYSSTTHEHALTQLLRAVSDDEGMMLVSGEPGTGKTLLGHCLLERLEANVTSALVTNSHFDDCTALLQAILYDLSLPYEGSGQLLRLRLTDFLLENCANGNRTVLVLDEAHHLRDKHLEELRLLGNLEAGQGKAFQVILLSQPSLLERLVHPDLAACSQRMATRIKLEPMRLEESIDYLLHHLRAAGGRPNAIIDEVALEIIAQGTHGVPRLLNQTAHQAFLLADRADMRKVDAEAALEALSILGLEQNHTGFGDDCSVNALDGAIDESKLVALVNPEALGDDSRETAGIHPRRPA